MVRDQRQAARQEPWNIPLQIQVDRLEQIIPEAEPGGPAKGCLGGVWVWVLAFLLAGAVFCAGLYAHRAEAGGGAFPPQIAIIQPDPDPFSWVEAITAVGIMLAGIGSCGWVVRKRRGLGG